ncbi:transporter substrate-binding domain-containing protein [Paenarthrobacter sp. RAF54_2]|uniref:transporter substrate-binding domain-containing protein n=1 Tax=Micrococcaceae TaxID=1268 RepID=UPI003F91C94E
MAISDKTENDTQEAQATKATEHPGRRGLIAGAAAGAAVFGLTRLIPGADGGASSGGAGAPDKEPLVDKWRRTKEANLGWEFSTPLMQFRNSAGEPDGFSVEMIKMMMADLDKDIKINFTEMPFAQLVPALVSGKVEMLEPVTNLPTRANEGMFADIPANYAAIYALRRPGSTLEKDAQLNDPAVKIAVIQGSSQAIIGAQRYPRATFVALADATVAIAEVASGRADITLASIFNVMNGLRNNPGLTVLPGDPLYVDVNTFLLPQGDFKSQVWVSNWLRHHAGRGTIATLWNKWVGDALRTEFKLPVVTVGPGGALIEV